jgi:hypothetical protein
MAATRSTMLNHMRRADRQRRLATMPTSSLTSHGAACPLRCRALLPRRAPKPFTRARARALAPTHEHGPTEPPVAVAPMTTQPSRAGGVLSGGVMESATGATMTQ